MKTLVVLGALVAVAVVVGCEVDPCEGIEGPCVSYGSIPISVFCTDDEHCGGNEMCRLEGSNRFNCCPIDCTGRECGVDCDGDICGSCSIGESCNRGKCSEAK